MLEVLVAEEVEVEGEDEEDMLMMENFIVGMTRTFGNLSVDEIHSKLSSYLSTYAWKITDLNNHLAKMVKGEKLEFSNGEFSEKK
jgi:hypothetical protein